MIKTLEYSNWQLTKDNHNILWAYLDKAGSSVNSLDESIFSELETILKDVEANPKQFQAIIFSSKKNSGFIHGANIEQFTKLKTIEEAKGFIQRGQKLFDRIEALPIPTIAMINGFCLGGGLELALACTYRVAIEDGHKIIGLPEVLLGIHPGWGGSVRLPRLIGALKALDMILSGRSISAKAALKMGIIDAAVPQRHLQHAAEYYALKQPLSHQPSFLEKMTNVSLLRRLIANYIRTQKLAKQANKNHYPAPYAILENWEKFGVEHKKALEGEANLLARLVLDDTAKNLVRVFFLRERMKSLAKNVDFKVKQVHVVGAGVMGGDIATWCALKGLQVTLQDQSKTAIAKTLERAYQLFKKKLKESRLIQAAMDRLQPDVEGIGVASADIIIEAIVEKLTAKQSLLKTLESKMKPEAILATNTSSIPLDEINSVLEHPEKLVGIHFFNPVAKMQLVEVVHGKKTSETVIKQSLAFVKQIGRLPVPVTSTPGFLVNRILMPYLMECMLLLEEGVPPVVIDNACKDFGMPMGPVELADTVGLDICLSVAENLTQYFGGVIPLKLQQMVQNDELGRKTGRGFYHYNSKGKQIQPVPKDYSPPADLTDRLILRLVNEAMTCLNENVVADGDLLDAAMIFGTGFAPFRGGPMNYACVRGIDNIKQRLLELTEKYGKRFQPAAGFNIRSQNNNTAASVV